MKDLLVKKENHLLWITLNRPESANAISLDMVDSLCRELQAAELDPEVRVVILKGAGKHFCAGGDVKAMHECSGMFAGQSNELRLRYHQGIQRIPRTIEAFQKPIIAMIHGAAVGAGLDLACMCDLRVASMKARFAQTFSKLSLVPGDGGSFFLQRVVGYTKAMEMFLTADFYDATEAKNFGLISRLVNSTEEKDLEEQVRELAQKISQLAPVSLSMTKMALKRGRTEDLNSQLELLAALQGIAQRTQDHQKAVEAQLKGESPEFSGF